MPSCLILACEGKNDEAVVEALVERLAPSCDEGGGWVAGGGDKNIAFLYWQEWKGRYEALRATLSIPRGIRELRRHRGEALMALKVTHLLQREAPQAIIILVRDLDGKEGREHAWHVFREVRRDVVTGLARNSIESWVLACWDVSDQDVVEIASAWVGEHRGTRFDPFREPERLTPTLSKGLLAHLDCASGADYAIVLSATEDARFGASPARRVGLRDFVEQLAARLSDE